MRATISVPRNEKAALTKADQKATCENAKKVRTPSHFEKLEKWRSGRTDELSPSPTDNDASRRVLRERSRGDPVSETNVAVGGRSRTAVKGDSHAVVKQPESVERLFPLRSDTEEGDSHDESDDGDDLEGRSPVLDLSVPPNAGEVDSDHGHPERGDVGRGRGGRVPEGDDDGTGGQLDRDRNSP